MSEEKNHVGIRVDLDLVGKIILLKNWNPDMPANYAVDTALREYIEILESKKDGGLK